MSWVFLPGRGAGSSLPACSVGAQSVPSSSSPTLRQSWPNDSSTDTLSPSRSGATCELSMATLGADESTLSAAVSPAKTSAAPASESDLLALARASGSLCCASLAKSGLRTSSPKTPRIFEVTGLSPSSKALPVWGSMQRGACWALTTSAPRTVETGSGLSLPTPTGAGNEASPSMQKWPAHRALGALMATPTASGSDARNTNRPSARATRAMLPTPTATLYGSNGWSRDHAAGIVGPKRPSLGGLVGGIFIALREWMMGWPIGWTAPRPLETGRFQLWLHSHGAR